MDSFVDRGVKLKGTLWAKKTLHFEGELEGDCYSKGHLIIGKEGVVKGNINSRNISNLGIIEGNLHAENKVSLLPGSRLKGNIESHNLVMQEGSNFEGQPSCRSLASRQRGSPIPSAAASSETYWTRWRRTCRRG